MHIHSCHIVCTLKKSHTHTNYCENVHSHGLAVATNTLLSHFEILFGGLTPIAKKYTKNHQTKQKKYAATTSATAIQTT